MILTRAISGQQAGHHLVLRMTAAVSTISTIRGYCGSAGRSYEPTVDGGQRRRRSRQSSPASTRAKFTMRCTARSSRCRRSAWRGIGTAGPDIRAIFFGRCRGAHCIVCGVASASLPTRRARGGSTRLRSTARWRGRTPPAVRPARSARGFIGDAFECRFYSGTKTQGADPLEVAMFGAEAVAYRPQMMLWFSNLPVTAFDNKVPFVSVQDRRRHRRCGAGRRHQSRRGVGAVRLFALARIRQQFVRDHGVADIVQGMILTEDQSFLDLLQRHRAGSIARSTSCRPTSCASTIAARPSRPT